MNEEDESVEKIGIDTPFYSVWGDLIGAAGLCKSFRDKGFEVSIEEVFEHPTIREQMRLLKGRQILYT